MLARRTSYGTRSAEPITDPRASRWSLADVGFASFRVAVALLVVWHGLQEHFGILLAPGATWGGALVPFSDPWILATVRLTGGLLLALGLFTQPTAVVLATLVALNHLAATGARAHWMTTSTELALLYAIALLSFALIGPGMFSIDSFMRARRARRRTPGMTVEMSPWVQRQSRRRDLAR